jgi:acetyl/propionyl-CoA carboxylase alpha subunit
MEALGSKTSGRQLARRSGVPIVPGTNDPIEKPADAKPLALDMGYPVLLKAVAGGGGKGMRIVYSDAEFDSAFRDASSEAMNAFGDARLYLEKYLECPRHVEIQILADAHGRVVSLGERECSVQRRHQKVIEEAPSPIVTPDLRKRMGDAAVRLTRAGGYVNAGTVEFLVDAHLNFYFLEVNTRLQVEHPVSTPKIPTTISFPRLAKFFHATYPAAREFAWMTASTKAGRYPTITILCSAN